MSLYRPSELIALLNKLHITPKKRLSQNFLIDGNIVEKALSAAKLSKGDIVLEIGPGPGVMTQAMLVKGAHVIAVEKDHRFISHLRSLGNAEIYEEDFLDFPLHEKIKIFSQKIKVISNLPFKTAAPIIGKLLLHHTHFSSMTLMVQKEVAIRMAAQPNCKEYSSFSVFIQYHALVTPLFTVSPHCFFPRPRVTSSFIRLDIKKLPEQENLEDFFTFVRVGFQKRRKKLTSSLQALFPKKIIEHALEKLALSPHSRPEELNVDTLHLLFKEMHYLMK